jgi:hypothetical protein
MMGSHLVVAAKDGLLNLDLNLPNWEKLKAAAEEDEMQGEQKHLVAVEFLMILRGYIIMPYHQQPNLVQGCKGKFRLQVLIHGTNPSGAAVFNTNIKNYF